MLDASLVDQLGQIQAVADEISAIKREISSTMAAEISRTEIKGEEGAGEIPTNADGK